MICFTRVALLTKINNAMRDLATMLLACEQQLTTHNDRLAAIERTRTTLEADIVTPETSLQVATQPTTTTASSPSPVAKDNVVLEINLRAPKQSNLIISGVEPSLLPDDNLITHLLPNEQSLTTLSPNTLA